MDELLINEESPHVNEGPNPVAEAARATSPKVYHTFYSIAGTDYTFLTTSKEVHLQLGLLNFQGIEALCTLFDNKFKATHGGETFFCRFEGGRWIDWLVSRADHPEEEVYHISPAR